MSLLTPTSSGRLGPPSRAPNCRRRRNDASPPGPDTRSTAFPMIACSSSSRACAVNGRGPAPVRRARPAAPGGPATRTPGPTRVLQHARVDFARHHRGDHRVAGHAGSARPGRCRLGQVLAAGESARHDAMGSVMASPGALGGTDAERRTGSFDLACGEPDRHVVGHLVGDAVHVVCVVRGLLMRTSCGSAYPTVTTSPSAHHRMTPAADLRPRHHRVPVWPADTDAAKSHVSRREFRSPAGPRLPGRRGPGSVVRCQPPRALTMFMMVTICGAPLTAYPGPGPV